MGFVLLQSGHKNEIPVKESTYKYQLDVRNIAHEITKVSYTLTADGTLIKN
jgi:hypothetical protein